MGTVEDGNKSLRILSPLSPGIVEYRRQQPKFGKQDGKMKQKPVVIRTPVPTLEKFAERLGISKARRKRIEKIMNTPVKRKKKIDKSKKKVYK